MTEQAERDYIYSDRHPFHAPADGRYAMRCALHRCGLEPDHPIHRTAPSGPTPTEAKRAAILKELRRARFALEDPPDDARGAYHVAQAADLAHELLRARFEEDDPTPEAEPSGRALAAAARHAEVEARRCPAAGCYLVTGHRAPHANRIAEWYDPAPRRRPTLDDLREEQRAADRARLDEAFARAVAPVPEHDPA